MTHNAEIGAGFCPTCGLTMSMFHPDHHAESESPLEMALEMHQIQLERANRLQAENDRLRAALVAAGVRPELVEAIAHNDGKGGEV